MFFSILFPEGKKYCVTFSYDDGRVEDRRLVELFNRHNVKATFHLNSQTLGVKDGDAEFVSPDEIAELYVGHEVSCHGYTHPSLNFLTKDQMVSQLIEDRRNLEKYAGYPIRGMSYPYGDYSDVFLSLASALGMEYSRTVNSTHDYHMPNDFMQWHPTCHHNDALSLVDDFLAKPAGNRLKLFYIWGHSFEFKYQNNWNMMEELVEKISGNDDIWYATNIEIKDYMTAARNLVTSVDGTSVYNTSAKTVWLDVDGRTVMAKPGEVTKF